MENIKVMTFNLRVDAAKDPFPWAVRREWALRLIEENSPDLIGTQEANPKMFQWLSEALSPSYLCYGVNRNTNPEIGEYTAIFVRRSRFEIVRQNSFWLSETPEVPGSMGWDAKCLRICSWVEIADKPSGRSLLRYFNTHLDHIGHTAQQEGLRLILREMQKENNILHLPGILTGDFNVHPESDIFEVMKDFESMQSCFSIFPKSEASHMRTFNGYRNEIVGKPIDYIFCSTDCSLQDVKIIRDHFDTNPASDHYPVTASLAIND